MPRVDSPSAPGFATWASGSKHNMQVEVYLFNVTNPHEMLAGSRPILEALPPIALERTLQPYNVSWAPSPTGPRVLFASKLSLEVVDDHSNLRRFDEAKVTTLYMPGIVLLSRQYGVKWALARALGLPPGTPLQALLRHPGVAAAARAAFSSPLDLALAGATEALLTPAHVGAARVLSAALSLGSALLFTQRSPKELVLGYPDDIFQALHTLDARFPSLYPGLLPDGESKSPRGISSMDASGPRVGQLRERDGSASLYCCASGPCVPSEHGDSLPAWATPEANQVGGSASLEQFPPSPQLESAHPGAAAELAYFSFRMQRSVPLVPASNPSPSSGYRLESAAALGPDLQGISYTVNPRTFASAAELPENAAYYSFGPSGLYNASACSLAHSPVFFSLPYFLHGNGSLNEAIGLPPAVPSLHDTTLLVEPFSGTLLQGFERYQENLFLTPLADMGLFPALPQVYLPLLWVSESYLVSQQWRDAFEENFVQPRARGSYISTAGGVIAAVLAVLAIVQLSPVKASLLGIALGGKGISASGSSRGREPPSLNASGSGAAVGAHKAGVNYWGFRLRTSSASSASGPHETPSYTNLASSFLHSLLYSSEVKLAEPSEHSVPLLLQHQQHPLFMQLEQTAPRTSSGDSHRWASFRSGAGRLSSVAELDSGEEEEQFGSVQTPPSSAASWTVEGSSRKSSGSQPGSIGSASGASEGRSSWVQHPLEVASPGSNQVLLGAAVGSSVCSGVSGGSGDCSSLEERLQRPSDPPPHPPTLGALQSSWGPAFQAGGWE